MLGASPSTPEAVTPQRGVPEASGPVSVPSDRPSESKNLGEIRQETYNPAMSSSATSSVNAAASSVANALPSSADIQAQLADAKAQISRLTQQIGESSGLRQRKTDTSSSSGAQLSTATETRAAPAGGVPVQITAGLCLLSFLIAYFLF
jgi:hypothetical protein